MSDSRQAKEWISLNFFELNIKNKSWLVFITLDDATRLRQTNNMCVLAAANKIACL